MLNGSLKQSPWQNYIPYVLNILITVRCFNGLLILFSVFFPVVKKKSMSYFVKRYICLHLFPTKNSFNLQRQKIPPILSDDICIFSLIINHRQVRMALNIENSSLWVGKWKVKAIRKDRRHFSSGKITSWLPNRWYHIRLRP